jgi:hypothetical protein
MDENPPKHRKRYGSLHGRLFRDYKTNKYRTDVNFAPRTVRHHNDHSDCSSRSARASSRMKLHTPSKEDASPATVPQQLPVHRHEESQMNQSTQPTCSGQSATLNCQRPDNRFKGRRSDHWSQAILKEALAASCSATSSNAKPC